MRPVTKWVNPTPRQVHWTGRGPASLPASAWTSSSIWVASKAGYPRSPQTRASAPPAIWTAPGPRAPPGGPARRPPSARAHAHSWARATRLLLGRRSRIPHGRPRPSTHTFPAWAHQSPQRRGRLAIPAVPAARRPPRTCLTAARPAPPPLP